MKLIRIIEDYILELIRIIQGVTWKSPELYREIHGTQPNSTG